MKSLSNFPGLHPRLVEAATKVATGMAALGHPIVPTQGLRSEDEQQKLFAQGRTAPGHIVTNADGILRKSNHQAQADGWGHAVDFAFLDADGKPSWDLAHPWHVYGALAKFYGLKWGGDWNRLKDYPHLEL